MIEIAMLIAAGAGIIASAAYGISRLNERFAEKDPASRLLKKIDL